MYMYIYLLLFLYYISLSLSLSLFLSIYLSYIYIYSYKYIFFKKWGCLTKYIYRSCYNTSSFFTKILRFFKICVFFYQTLGFDKKRSINL